jgi:hypothetical chaperone protein
VTKYLGFDFGTSNTAVAYVSEGKVTNIALDPDVFTTPTSVFFDFTGKKMLIGAEANDALIGGFEGRYMRALKSVLGTSLMQEKRLFLGRRMDFYDIITDFIVHVKRRAETSSQRTFDHVLAGRPVFFHSENIEKDIAAENDLRECFSRAGFARIEFMHEPEAAAFAAAKNIADGAIGLVVDIGGGTSDFTLFQMQDHKIKIMASNGLRLGGTDFDRIISFDYFMPLLGRGGDLKRHFAKGTIQAPAHIFAELATWEKIPFLYDQKTKQLAVSLVRDAVQPHLFERLLKVLELRMGHDLAFLAEDTKIALNQTPLKNPQHFSVDMGFIEQYLKVEIAPDSLDNTLAGFEKRIVQAIMVTLKNGNIDAKDVTKVIPVGGSSSMAIVKRAIQNCLPNAIIQSEAVFTSIVDGLAIRGGQLETGQ